MEKVITKIRGKVYIKDIIRKYHLEKTMCEFLVSVFIRNDGTNTHEKLVSKIIKPMHEKLKGNNDYVNSRIVVFDTPSEVEKKQRSMGILFWHPYNMDKISDDLMFDPGRYTITVKTIDNKE